MTASPVTMQVQTPAGPAMVPEGVLGAAAEDTAPSRRSRRIRARDHGHSGKHLNIAVVPSPAAGSYKVQLTGTDTGSFALGAMLVSASGVQILGGSGDGASEDGSSATSTSITTTSGQTARESELHYEVICFSSDNPPEIRLDVAATAYSALRKLRAGVQSAQAGVLGGTGADPVGAVLGGSPASDEVRGTAEAALAGDDDALDRAAAMIGSEGNRASMADLLATVAELVIGGQDQAQAAAILAQIQALR
jgi:hypothetical protein